MFNEINSIKSKVIGRRNWVIKTIDNTAYLMSWGWADRHNAFVNTLDYIAEHNVRWLTFTYKKDVFEALEELAKIGYQTEIRA
jgi:hypothetical protein